MNILDLLITLGILAWFGIMIYLKMSKRTFNELMIELKDLIKPKKK